jgi:signal transduction histidine kinase
MPDSPSKTGRLRFSVDARLLFELGEQLVARKSIALGELVKNAFDADATKVVVALNNVTTKSGQIVVTDDGEGMAFDEVRTRWMRIATTGKQSQQFSPKYRRPRAGAKGIGRFASRRLARKLILRSVAIGPSGNKERTTITFDWDRFKSGRDLDAVANQYTVESAKPEESTGVTLTLEDLRETWGKEDVEEVERDLLGLITPISLPKRFLEINSGDPGFRFNLIAPEFPELSGALEERYLEAAWGVLTATTDQHGNAKYALRSRDFGRHTFSPEKTFPSAGRVYVRIHFMVFRSQLFRNFPFGVAAARDVAREHAGVRIFMDTFRVFPYGDPGDDWLDIDSDRGKRATALPPELDDISDDLTRPMLALPGNNQLFGAVLLSRARNPKIQLNISRERLITNNAFIELKNFVRLGIDWMTVQYARAKASDQTKQAALRDPAARLRLLRSQIEETPELERESKTRLLQALELAETDWESFQRDQISELSMIRVLASVGTMVVIFDHELRAVIDAFKGVYTDLRRLAHAVPSNSRGSYGEALERLKRWTVSVEEQGKQIGLLLSTEARMRRRRLALRQVVDDLARPFKRYMDELGVRFKNRVPAEMRTPAIFPCELQSILLNLQTNSLKALKSVEHRSIAVSATRSGGMLHVLFQDTGTGVPVEMREEVFKPFVTTSAPDPVLGVGTGLGLKIVRDLASVYGGSARFIEAKPPWTTCVEISLPYAQ